MKQKARGKSQERVRSRGAKELDPTSLAYSIRQSAGLLAQVLEGCSLTQAWEAALRRVQWNDAQRGAVRDLTWNALRDYGRGDRVLEKLLSSPLPENVRSILLVALSRLERRPQEAYRIVDQAVDAVASMAPGLKGVVNGVLRNRMRQEDSFRELLLRDEVAHWQHPDWWIKRVRRSYPTEWQSVLEAGNSHPPMCLRINCRKVTENEYARMLEQAGISWRRIASGAYLLETPLPAERVPGLLDGWVSVQDAGAQRAAHLLGPQNGERVLDACAAPGGKTAHILELADVELLALDADAKRLARVDANLTRLGLSAKTCTADARQVEAWWDGQTFDRILADVPCSASGVVRRHPDIKWHRRNKDIAGFARLQAELLESLWQTLAPGGTMLYATCSVFDEENTEQVQAFCARNADAERQPLDGREELQLLPDAVHDGFYYALLRKCNKA